MKCTSIFYLCYKNYSSPIRNIEKNRIRSGSAYIFAHSRIRIQVNRLARLLFTSSPKRFIANERDEIRNETKLFLGNAPAFIFLLSFTIPLRKERAEREREREKRYSAQKEV